MDAENLEVTITDALDEYEDEGSSVRDDDGTLPANRYVDRELSWLAFNQRVLELSEDQTVPLLERANFSAIFANNLDEFFMVRVAGLKRRIDTGLAVPTNIGTPPAEVYANIATKAHELQERHARGFKDDIGPALAALGQEVHALILGEDHAALSGDRLGQHGAQVGASESQGHD